MKGLGAMATPAPVGFQVGYPSDRKSWKSCSNPPHYLALTRSSHSDS
jgi:hypothetical protein